ncbi:hypothetical protein [Pelosinus propionicus]|uniref:DUF288 domain-containing protein n=1 Tax=Pelosinus propionicus DSM 13327 TaxID=1123291 RepID=A0A1I4JRI3_9FIRM|nr:hypothetical protein [Pelosinus propionicus]SFL68931.1 hypothetical protein SAMN04490355_1013102 [Pelosinus propionicus DSM 13327]
MSQPITIATSLAPGKDVKIQKEAVNSWHRLGFVVISINCAEEIAVLKSSFPEIEFIEVARDARQQFGKPYIYFDDILACLWERESSLCGIVNSDICFLKHEFYSFLTKEGRDSFIYGSRIDISTFNHVNGRVIQDGFDYFFFDRKVIAAYPASQFCIGMPCWDYWAVLSPLFLGVAVKKVMTAHAYHIIHKVNWNNTISSRLFHELLHHIKPLSAVAASANYMLSFIDRYSLKLNLQSEGGSRKQLQNLLPQIKKVLTKGDIQGEIIDELLFLRRK